ncbi:hypothetical protein [Halomonas sp. NO4]|uniref:hypothetical protein n=1 Tax=Halomonas sp. NO4 TaxID=2484813 RepID=UPI0013D59140|nr:hypothetical protein [Halomonas sp. NO4]
MTNAELAQRRAQLADKQRAIAGMPAMAAMGTIKNAALLMAEITDELARRELVRGELTRMEGAADE